ncbi:MAG TPA: hypothetical protein VH107_12970 [Lacipirellulaceae bacterium]|jgi:hypothetical protein|nr:hypothetical protein [Lacipirellulaceae bacterium]
MRRYLLILMIALVFGGGGCQLMDSATYGVKQSLSRAADDYHQVTTGGDSRYIQSQGRQY